MPVATPVASPKSKTFTGASQSVTLSCSTTGADIYYTTNGDTPSATSGTKYSSAISLTATTTIKAIAVKAGMADSEVLTETYTKSS